MRYATLAAMVVGLVAAAMPGTSGAAVPEGKIAVVRVTAIDGLATWNGPVVETRSTAFTYNGTDYRIDPSALGGLTRIQTVILIDRRTDEIRDGVLMKHHGQEVRGVAGEMFEVTDIPGKSLAYQVAMVGGNLRLLGDGDQIVAKAGENGPYHIWKIEGIDLVNQGSVILD